MSTCQRCWRCSKEPNPLEQLKLKGYRFDDLAQPTLDLPLPGVSGRPAGAGALVHVDMQLAAFALSQGDADGAIATADRALPQALRAQNAALTATLMMVKAEALA